jgi:dolichyl-phosphate-mannose-protein mannosyltransferase
VYTVLYVVIVGLFVHFRAIVFGMEGSNSQWAHLRWLPGWKISN